ncbi:MAG: cupin domain-containing protein [Pseudomonadota bacterium]
MKPNVFRYVANPDAGMAPSQFTPDSCFTSVDHSETNHTFFASEDESVLAGVWECAPCVEDIEGYPVNEMMTVLSGSVTLTTPDGQVQTFTSGDSFFIAKGAPCRWEITETLKKYYLICE